MNNGFDESKVGDWDLDIRYQLYILKVDRLTPNAWNSLGFVNLKLKNNSDAIVDYQNALKIDPSMASSIYGIRLADHALGDDKISKSKMQPRT